MGQTMGKPSRSLGERAITALLTNPVARSIKRPVRDLLWTIKGASLANPPLPTNVQSILFVCLGNICRSPFAEMRLAQRLMKAGEGSILCASAGLRPTQGARPPDEAVIAAARYGLALAGHRPRAVTGELVESHDLVVVMEAGQLEVLRSRFPQAADRTVLLSLFDSDGRTGYERYNIADPFSQPLEVYEACYRRIDRTVTSLMAGICSGRARVPAAASESPPAPR